jgi:hypothetical protein
LLIKRQPKQQLWYHLISIFLVDRKIPKISEVQLDNDTLCYLISNQVNGGKEKRHMQQEYDGFYSETKATAQNGCNTLSIVPAIKQSWKFNLS